MLSYNVLHEFGASRLLRARGGGGVPAWAKDRLHHVGQLIAKLGPDVVCLQEVDAAAHGSIEKALGDDFVCAAAMRNESLPPRDGCAIFVRKSKFEVSQVHQFKMRDTVHRHFPEVEEVRSRAAGMTAAFWRELHEKLNMSLALQLKPVGTETSIPELCVSTTHLFWDPQYPDLKLLQAYFLARELEQWSGGLPLVLAGDLNSTPSGGSEATFSGVYELLTCGAVDASHADHPVTLRPSRGILGGVTSADVPELKLSSEFRSAYKDVFGKEAVFTNASKHFGGCLDYIMYRASSSDLSVVSARELPTDLGAVLHQSLPSPAHPSDHLPVLAEFEINR